MAGTPQPGPPYRGRSVAGRDDHVRRLDHRGDLRALGQAELADRLHRDRGDQAGAASVQLDVGDRLAGVDAPDTGRDLVAGAQLHRFGSSASSVMPRAYARLPMAAEPAAAGVSAGRSGALRMTGPWRDRSRPVLDADPAQVPRDPAIVSGPRGDGQLDHGFVVAVVTAAIAERIVQVGPPLRGGHQAGLDEREPVEEPRDVGAAARDERRVP